MWGDHRGQSTARVEVKGGRFRFDVRKGFLIFGLPRSIWAPARGPAVRERKEKTHILVSVSAMPFGISTFPRQGLLGLF